ncbi:MAG: LpxI family protein [Aquificae bacterium]|nr:LpxI family protein [Aquificota bacterium]
MGKIGLIAGAGELPRAFVEGAARKGREVLVVGVEGISEGDLTVPLGRVGKLIKLLKKEGVKELVLLGKFEPRLVYASPRSLDLTGLLLYRRLRRKNPEGVVKTFMEFMQERGFTFIDPTPYLKELLAPKGLVAGPEPPEEVLKDGLTGFKVAKELASLDVGQTVVVKEGAVVAVEAMEGTQETIRRAARLAGEGFSVVKAARRLQDMRVDVPTVGPETLKAVKEGGGRALFLEAEKVFILKPEEVKRMAEAWGVTVWGL